MREVERAERQKRIELVQASKEAEREQITITIAARADREAAEQKGEAIRILANANADQRRIGAEADAAAEKMRAEADAVGEKARAEAAQVRYDVDAAGQRKLNEAANLMSAEQIAMQLRMALLKHLPDIIRESVKPMQSIEGIKIVQVEGLNVGAGGNSGGGSGDGGGSGNGNLAEQVVASALRYRAQAPLLDSLMRDVGLSGGDLAGLTAPTSDDEWRAKKLDEINKKRDNQDKK